MSQPGLFDQQIILKRRDKKGDPLARLNSVVNWNIFLPTIETALPKKGTLQKADIFLVWAIRSIFFPVRFAEFAG